MELSYLRQRQSNPLEVKVQMSLIRIREWYERWDGDVFVSYSGGKDSDVLLHLVRSIYPKVTAMMLNTRIEYPAVIKHCHQIPNIQFVKPQMRFSEVLSKYGYPVVSKEQSLYIYQCRNTNSDKLRQKRLHGSPGKPQQGKISNKWQYLLDAPFMISDKCCYALKKKPADQFVKHSGLKPFLGTKACDSWLREMDVLRYGCNAICNRPAGRPISFWLDEDIYKYIEQEDIEICSLYEEGYRSTGCMFCCFGLHMESEPNRLQRLAKTNPRLWSYGIHELGIGNVLDFMDIDYMPSRQLELSFH